MRSFLASTALWLMLCAGFWYALTTTMTDLTLRDCAAGVQSACDQLRKDGAQ